MVHGYLLVHACSFHGRHVNGKIDFHTQAASKSAVALCCFCAYIVLALLLDVFSVRAYNIITVHLGGTVSFRILISKTMHLVRLLDLLAFRTCRSSLLTHFQTFAKLLLDGHQLHNV